MLELEQFSQLNTEINRHSVRTEIPHLVSRLVVFDTFLSVTHSRGSSGVGMIESGNSMSALLHSGRRDLPYPGQTNALHILGLDLRRSALFEQL